MKPKELMLQQLDQQLPCLPEMAHLSRPRQGWVRTVRQAFSMTTKQLADRLNVHRSRVIKIEQAETEDAITLRTLRHVAHALECELVYAFVPKTSLGDVVKQQAYRVAKQRVARVAHSMALEDQATTPEQQQKQVEILAKNLLENFSKHIWDEDSEA